MKARDIAAAIEEFAPLATQEPWDNSGFSVGSPDAEVCKVLVAFDCTAGVIREAVSAGADMVVTHHPLIFGGLKRIDPRDPVGEAVILAVKNGITVYSAHTNADKAAGGVNSLMACRLELEDVAPLDESGLVLAGYLHAPLTGTDFCVYVKDRFGVKDIRSSSPVKSVYKVATSCGSGSSFAALAESCGADAFVTGDVSYHHFFTRKDFMVVDVGHYESEIDIVGKFAAVLKEKLPTFAVCTTTHRNNPIYHY